MLTSNLVEVLGALSSEAVGGFTSLSNLGGLGVGNSLLGHIRSIDGYVFSGNFLAGRLSSTVPGFLVVTVEVKSVVFLLELVIGSGGRLGLSLGSRADGTISFTIVGNLWASQLRSLWITSTSWSWSAAAI